jgi:hypothetical protein
MSQDMVQQVSKDDFSDDEDEDSPLLCTFAATGTNPAFQAIFVCLDCASDKDNGVCICRACADACHDGHDVDFMGMGPAYCDCPQLGTCCRLQSASQAEAARLGIHLDGMKPHVAPQEGNYLQEVFTISSLLNDHVCDRLVREAIELIQHSRDTHWLDFSESSPEKKSCKLEDLALSILQRHVHEYFGRDFHGGAEWWVQVKPVSLPGSNHVDINEAIDLHYDKDENLAESFDLGSFPTLSTVTYLSLNYNASPTLVFPHTYDKDEGEVMQDMLVSYPRRGKHVVFDGRLLHGAPAHHALRQSTTETVSQGSSVEPRVTFLVNVWPNGPPLGVKRLPTDFRQRVRQAGKLKKGLHISSKKPTIEFESREIHCVDLETVEDLAEPLGDRIELPFVSKGATWIGKTQGNDLVVVTFPPPTCYEDTIKVRFGPGLQAYLEYKVQHKTTAHPNDDGSYSEDYV